MGVVNQNCRMFRRTVNTAILLYDKAGVKHAVSKDAREDHGSLYDKLESVLPKDRRGWEAVFVAGVSVWEVFIARDVEVGPGFGADADDSGGVDAFGDEVGFEADMDAAAW